MARDPRERQETAPIALRRNTDVHLGPCSGQSQPLTPVPTHLPGRVAPTHIPLHHRLRLHVEHCPIRPRLVRLRAHEPDLPCVGRQVPRQSHYLVHRRRDQYHDRLHRLRDAYPAH